MNGSEVGVLEKGDEVSLSSLLEGHHSRGLEAEVGLQCIGEHDPGKETEPDGP